MTKRTQNDLLEEVLNAYQRIDDPRLREIILTIIRHVHAAASEMNLTFDEWMQGMEFLKNVGQTCTEDRQEFILFSDLLGLSACRTC